MWSAEKMCIGAEQWYVNFLEERSEKGTKEAEFIITQTKRKIKNAKRLLDIPCGTGRVSIPLAKSGLNVTGLDASNYYVHVAKRKAKANKVDNRTKFIFGNMRNIGTLLKNKEKFDVVINVFTSIGYGTKKDDLEFFRSLRLLTNKGGLFFISTLANRNTRDEKPWSHFEKANDIVLIDEGRFNKRTSHSRSKWRFFKDNGRKLELKYSQIVDIYLYSPSELKKMLEGTGWKVIAIYNKEKKKVRLTKSDSHFNVLAQAV